jgi:enterochelin esterase family protein
MRTVPFLLAALLCAQRILSAQAATPPPVNSAEVHPDRSITFRIRAPKASAVTFFGDWMKTGDTLPMKRDSAGVWSVTTAPLPPSIYLYNFNVDGVSIADPVNPRIKLRSRTSASMLEVRAASPAEAPWQAREVPHGSVEINWVDSTVLLEGKTEPRQVWIYTPPGYAKSANRRYPVLYLFHGSNDTAGGWTLAGQMNFILDNLLSEGKMEPMIVAMPYGHAVPFAAPREQQARNVELFEQHLLRDVMPLVESKYRLKPGREQRAIAGLSMGGGQAIAIGFRHLDRFSAIGAFSAAVPQDFETQFAGLLAAPGAANAKLKVLWVGCGREDFLFERNAKFAALLTAKGIRNTWRATEGNHTYTYWRKYLAEFAPLLFR